MSGLQESGMELLEREIYSTYGQGRSVRESVLLSRLCNMLRSTLRSYPTARLWRRKAEYGALLGGGTYLRVSYSADLTATQQRDLLALFAAWLVADPERLLDRNTPLGG
jgi:hypothetical protein